MLKSEIKQVFVESAGEDRKIAITSLIETIESSIPSGFEGRASGKMLSWDVPLSTYPDGYHCNPKSPLPFLSLANQKGFIALYHMGLYANNDLYSWFVAEYPKHAKYKLDMGKSCIRFKRIDDMPFKLIGELLEKMEVADWVKLYEDKVKSK